MIAEDAHSDAVRDPGHLPAYSQALGELEKARREAPSYAKRKGGSTFDPTGQDALRRARSLLASRWAKPLSPLNAYPPCTKPWHALWTEIDIPEQASAAIEHRVKRLEIEG